MTPRVAVSEPEARNLLGGISRTTIYELRSSGKLGFYRVGRRVTYDPVKHIAPYLERCERNKQAA